MNNLDQLRAAHALCEAANTDRASVSKIPAMILTNGLLGALAFACEADKKTREKMHAAAASLTRHFGQPALGFPELAGVESPTALIAKLAGGEAHTLQRATTEALAYFGYLKRYAPKNAAALPRA